MNVHVLSWVRVEKYCEMTGEPLNTVLDRVRDGKWAAKKHYKRTGPRTLWINPQEADQWISQQPHVEAMQFLKGSKSGRGNAATAFA